MTTPVEVRVLDDLLGQVRAKNDIKALIGVEQAGIWVPHKAVATDTPLQLVRGIQAAHQPPAEWIATLKRLSPRSDTASWLWLDWLEIGQRWVLYEMMPYPLVPESKRLQLGGTPYWELPKHLRAGRKQAVSAYQWEMYRRLKCWARPFAVIQGNDGGTPAKYSELEEAILQAQGHDTEPPEAGSLPYAPFDGRTERFIQGRDRLWKMNQRIETLRASGDNEALKAETDAAEAMFRKEFWSWWKDTMQPQAEFWAWYSAQDEATSVARRATENEQKAAELAEDTFLETGNLPLVLPNGELVNAGKI